MGSESSRQIVRSAVAKLNVAFDKELAAQALARAKKEPVSTSSVGILTTPLFAVASTSGSDKGRWSELSEDSEEEEFVESVPEELWDRHNCSVLATFLVERLIKDSAVQMSKNKIGNFVEAVKEQLWDERQDWVVSAKSEGCMLRIAMAVHGEVLNTVDPMDPGFRTAIIRSIRRHMERAKSSIDPKYVCVKRSAQPDTPQAADVAEGDNEELGSVEKAESGNQKTHSIQTTVVQAADECDPGRKWNKSNCLALVTYEFERLIAESSEELSVVDFGPLIDSLSQELWDGLPNWNIIVKTDECMFRIAMAVRQDALKRVDPRDPGFSEAMLQSYKTHMKKVVKTANKPSTLKRVFKAVVKTVVSCCCPPPED